MADREKKKSLWQTNKEELYDKVPLTVRQLDVIIALGILGLVVVFILIGLDAAGIIG